MSTRPRGRGRANARSRNLGVRQASAPAAPSGAPGQSAPGQPAPGQPAPGQPAPEQPASGQAAPWQPAPRQAAPGQAAPGQVAPGQAAPWQPAPGQAAAWQPAPGQTAPWQPASGQPAPGQTAPWQPAPGQTAPWQPAPGQPAPGQPASGQPAPGQPAPGQAAPWQPAPGQTAPWQPAPRQSAPRQPAPEVGATSSASLPTSAQPTTSTVTAAAASNLARIAARGRAKAVSKQPGGAGPAVSTPTAVPGRTVWATQPTDTVGPSYLADEGGRGTHRGDNKATQRPTGAVAMPTGDLEKLTLAGKDGEKQGEKLSKRSRLYHNPHTRPAHITNKKGNTGKSFMLLSNFFELQYKSDYVLHQYHVDYDPPIDSKLLRRGLFHEHGERLLRVYTFDGMIAFSPIKIHEEKTEVISVRKHDGARIRLIITRGQEIPKYSATLIQVFNLLMRQTLLSMGLEEVDRNYFSRELAIRLPSHKMEIWPGYNTSILQYEEDILLNVDLKHKVMRLDTAQGFINNIREKRLPQHEFRNQVHKSLLGQTVLTLYNEKQYRIHDIDWNLSPRDSFERKTRNGVTRVTYADYFKETYQREITDMTQPLLVHMVRKGDGQRLIHLLPELCKMTGLTDDMRTDFRLMRDMGVHTRVDPAERTRQMNDFRSKMDRAPRQPLKDFQLEVARNLLKVPGRVLPAEEVHYAPGPGPDGVKKAPAGVNADWSNVMKNGQLVSMTVNNWTMIFASNHRGNAENLRRLMFEIAAPMGMHFANPEMIMVNDMRATSFVQAMQPTRDPSNRFTLVVMPTNKSDFYSTIKRAVCLDKPHINQCVTNYKLSKQGGLRSVVTKIVIQINCKLGGEAWRIKMPIGGTMITGMDTYHDAGKRQSVAGFVATLTSNATRYYSFTNHQASRQELMPLMQQRIIASLKKWHTINGSLPKRVIAYRDGVGEGQLEVVRDMEVRQYLDAFSAINKGEAEIWDPDTQGQYTPEFAFIVVTKRINPRFFSLQRSILSNPDPGTVVDQVVTRMESYDFYLISQSVRQGTVTPAHYNIIYDSTSYPPDIMQRLAYKLCHLYYNWPGTIRVPAPCQYAHKLAYMTGTALHQTHNPQLNEFLFYL